MKSFEQAWAEAPAWRKVLGFLMFLSLWPTDQQIMDAMFGKGWDA